MKKNLAIKEIYLLAFKNYKKSKFIVSESLCNKILNIDPHYFEAIWLLALIAVRSKNFQLAKKFFIRATNIQPNNPKVINNLGNVQKELGEFNDAINSYQKSLEIESDNVNAYYNLGNVYQTLENFDQAILFYEKVIKIKKDYFNAYYNLGNVYQKLRDLEKAKYFYEETIKISPKYASAYNNLGMVFNKLGKIYEAIHCYEKTISVKPNHSGAHINLAQSFTELGKLDKAKNYYLKGAKFEPKNLSIYYYLSALKKEILDSSLKNKINKIFKENNTSKLNLAYGNFLLSKYEFKNKNYKKELDYLKKGHSHYFEANKKFKERSNYWLNELPKLKELSGLKEKNFKSEKKDHEMNPIFIVGVPRCGSTLIEKIIASGEKKIPMGEETVILNDFFEEQKILEKKSLDLEDVKNFRMSLFKKYENKGLIKKTKNYTFTDKSLENFFYLGLIKEIFPKAKIINCRRNMLSSIMSIYQSVLTGLTWTHKLDHIFKYFDTYLNTIEFYKKKLPNFIYELQFEKFVEEPTMESKKLMKFCGLPWNNECLKYYKRDDLISKTASNIQIRKSIYKHPIKKYEPYKKLLKEYSDKYPWFK